MPFPSEHKVGAFRDWKEDDELCEIFLPVPAGTLKADLVVVVTSETIRVRHVKLQKTLLCADPLAGPVQADESTWYLQEELLTIVLAKQWRGSTKSDQYWGDSMVPKLASAANAAPKQKDYLGLDEPTSVTTAKPVTFECYMTVAQVARARKEREQKEAEQEKERHARVKASQRTRDGVGRRIHVAVRPWHPQNADSQHRQGLQGMHDGQPQTGILYQAA